MRRLLLVAFGLLVIGASLAQSTFAAAQTAPAGSYVWGPTPTPIPGLPKHG
ncbi:MAG TPA: hypothetical protein VGL99_00835 [Chloroflexota bacterium]